MLSVLLVPLLISGTAPATPVATSRAAATDPTVRVSLDHSTYDRGDRARAKVEIRDDGYLVVLHISPDGLVRVLFPIDPTDDNFVRGGKSYEIRGRGDRESFTVSGTPGTGVIYAAWSGQPYRFDQFTRDGHWDYTVLGDSALASDPETGFTSLVGQMATGHFDYDLTTYTVAQRVAYSQQVRYSPDYLMYPGWGYPYSYDPYFYGYGGFGFGIGVGFGYPYYYSPFYSGFYRRPFFGGCFYCGPVVIYRPYRYARFPVSRYHWKGGIVGGGTVVGVQYRPRSVLGPNGFASTPGYRGRNFSGPGVATPWRTPGVGGGSAFARQPAMRPADLQGGRRVPVSLSRPNAPSNGERTVFAEPGRVNGQPMSPGVRTGTRAVPDRPRYEPSARTSPPARVSQPPTRAVTPPTRISEPRSAPSPRVSEPRSAPSPRVSEPRSAPSPRVAQPSSRRPEMRYESQPRFEPSVRSVEPRVEAPRAVQPRMERPSGGFSAPRAAPRVERSAGGFSAPRMSAPRASAPRMSSAPRASFGGGRRGGGGGGGHHH